MVRGITKAAVANVRRHERRTKDAIAKGLPTTDSYQNFSARLGIGASNLSSGSTYGFNPITRLRTLLEWMYRGSWIVGQAVDCIAEDMTKKGVTFVGEMQPDQIDALNRAFVRRQIWHKLQMAIKWGRLYGGAGAVVLIDGQKPETPLRLDTVGRNSFRGLLVMDRWMVEPTLNDLVTDLGSEDLGLPKFYNVTADAPALPRMRIHHSRFLRFEGVELPYWQKIAENLWGMSVVERLYDRLVAFDSGTQGASQLLFKAYLRTLSIPGLRNIVAAGGPTYEGLLKQVELMRQMQSSEGINIIDGEDKFEGASYTFSGLSEVIGMLGEQISGALQIPLVRLFGQSPAGLNSSGESDIRTYYDGIEQRQETSLRRPVDVVTRVIASSEGIKLPDSFGFTFAPLWQLDDKEKVEIAERLTNTVLAAEGSAALKKSTALKELRQGSKLTGVWTNITDEEIEQADMLPAPTPEELGVGLGAELGRGDEGAAPEQGAPQPQQPQKPRLARSEGAPIKGLGGNKDSLPLLEVGGLPVMIETRRGERRTGDGWSVTMPADYGYIRGTSSSEGADEGMDCFVGDERASKEAWIVNQCDPATGEFDEHKIMLGFRSEKAARDCYRAAYHDAGLRRIMSVVPVRLDDQRFLDWLRGRDHAREYEGRAAA